MAHPYLSGDSENIWMDKWRAHEAERNFVAHKYGTNNFKFGDSAKQVQSPSCFWSFTVNHGNVLV